MGVILGWTDEVTTCDCCGRKDLKRTVAVGEPGMSADDAAHYGCVCYARFVGISAADVRTAAKRADDERHKLEMARRDVEARVEHERWTRFLRMQSRCAEQYSTANADVFTMIEMCGGWKQAREEYNAWIAVCAAVAAA